MNKRRRAYKSHRERRRVPLGYASGYADDTVCFEIEPASERNRRYNAFKRRHGIPQKMAVRLVYKADGTRRYYPMQKKPKGLFLFRQDECISTIFMDDLSE